jgi:hypothetical protein
MTTYTLTVPVNIDGVTAPLQIHAESMNEVRRAVRLLKENGLLDFHQNFDESPAKATHLTHCKSCGAPISFVATQTGKRMPMDVKADGTLGASHFSSCPDATKFRRGAA